jgi:hypothetical protein
MFEHVQSPKRGRLGQPLSTTILHHCLPRLRGVAQECLPWVFLQTIILEQSPRHRRHNLALRPPVV